MNERELFELEYKKQMHTFNDAFCRYENGTYMNEKVSIAWGVWQASASRQGYKLVPLEPTMEMLTEADDCCIDGKVTAHIIYKAMIGAVE